MSIFLSLSFPAILLISYHQLDLFSLSLAVSVLLTLCLARYLFVRHSDSSCPSSLYSYAFSHMRAAETLGDWSCRLIQDHTDHFCWSESNPLILLTRLPSRYFSPLSLSLADSLSPSSSQSNRILQAFHLLI